jgi:30S ribosomal protein S31
MGKGDRKTAKGKRFAGSYGNSRPHGAVTPAFATSSAAVKTPAKAAAKRTPAAKKTAAKKAS